MTDCYSEHDTGRQGAAAGGGGGGGEGGGEVWLWTSLKINCTELSHYIHLNFVCVKKWMCKMVFVSSIAFIFLINSSKTNLILVAA